MTDFLRKLLLGPTLHRELSNVERRLDRALASHEEEKDAMVQSAHDFVHAAAQRRTEENLKLCANLRLGRFRS